MPLLNDFSQVACEIEKLCSPDIGSVLVLLGVARNTSKDGRKVEKIQVIRIEEPEKKIKKLKDEIITKFNVKEVKIFYKFGYITPGELITAIIISSKHRNEAFQAAMYCIDKIKEIFPLIEIFATPRG